jgi:hypothetical protein
MITKSVYLNTGYEITFQRISDKISHLVITDSKIYPDADSRSEEYWRKNGLLIPLNSDENINKIIGLLLDGKVI